MQLKEFSVRLHMLVGITPFQGLAKGSDLHLNSVSKKAELV